MAAVYKGRDDQGGEVALKVLHPDHATNPTVVGRFKREAMIMGLSKHPRAVRILEEGFTEINEPYYAMELLEHETLERRWKVIELFDPSRALTYIASLLEVLETYHVHGVIHRDIKPSNLIMDGDGLRLVDFGVSRYRDDAMPEEAYTRQGSMIGTPAYMAPEQAMGQVDRMDHRTDLFAVGAVLFCILCGRKLHQAPTAEQTLMKAATQPAESIARYAPDLDGILVAFVDKALQWFPEDRFFDAAEMLDELWVVKAAVDRDKAPPPNATMMEEADAVMGSWKNPGSDPVAPTPVAPTVQEPERDEAAFSGRGIMPTNFEIPSFARGGASKDEASEVFHTAHIEPDSEAWDAEEIGQEIEPPAKYESSSGPKPAPEPAPNSGTKAESGQESGDDDLFDSAIFKPGPEFTLNFETGHEGGGSAPPKGPEASPAPETSSPAPANDEAGPRFAIGSQAAPRPGPDPHADLFGDPFDNEPAIDPNILKSSSSAPRADSAPRPKPAPGGGRSTAQPDSPKPSADQAVWRAEETRRRKAALHRESDVERAAAIAFDTPNSYGDDFDDELIGFMPETLRPMFRSIERVFAGARMYEWEHPDVTRRVSEALDAVLEILEGYPDHCAFQIRRTEFAVDDEAVWRPEEPFDRIPFNLFAAGFRHVQFLPNLTDDDLAAFLKLAMLNPRTDLPIEDDLATAFWDLDLKSISAQMVTSFRVSDDESEQARFERDVSEIERDAKRFFDEEGAEQFKLLIALAKLGDGALAQAQHSRPELLLARRLNRGTFAAEYREQFVAALEDDLWLQRAVFVLVAALLDVAREDDPERLADPLRELVPRFLLEGKPSDLLELIDKVSLAVPEEHQELVFQWVFDKRNVDRFVRFVKNTDQTLDEETRGRAKTYLKRGSGDAMAAVLTMFVDFPAHKRELVADYLATHVAGHQAEVAEAVMNSNRDVALELIHVLKAVVDLTTAQALRQILDHADVEVRRTALGEMAEEYPSEIDDILLDMVQDGDANIRVQALKLASEARSQAVELYLTERALSSDFNELPFTERRLVMETLIGIDKRRGQETLIQIIKRKLNLRLDPAAHTTRTVAISLLGELGTLREAYEALEDVAKRRIGNPEKVREAARAAMKRWQERT